MAKLLRAFSLAAFGGAAAALLLVIAMQAGVGRWSLHNTLDVSAALVMVSLVTLLVCAAALLPFARRLRDVPAVAGALVAAAVCTATAAAFLAWFLATEDHSPVTATAWIAALAGPTAPAAIAGGIFGAVWTGAPANSASAA